MTSTHDLGSDRLVSVDFPALFDFLDDCHADGVVPLVYGAPGVGKTEGAGQYASKRKFSMLDERLSYRQPENVGSILLPDYAKREAFRLVPELIQRINTTRKETKKPVFVFLDEITLASRDVANVTLELLNERRIDGVSIPPDTMLCAAGNLPSHTPAATYLDAPVRSRVAAVNFAPTMGDFTAYLAANINHPTASALIPWLQMDEGRSIVDAIGHADGASPICTRRSAFRALKSVARKAGKKDNPSEAFERNRVMISALCGVEFYSKAQAYLMLNTSMVTAAELLANPSGVPVPKTANAVLAQLAPVTAHIKAASTPADMVNALVVYLQRLSPSHTASWFGAIEVADNGLYSAIKSTRIGRQLIEDSGANADSSGMRRRA